MALALDYSVGRPSAAAVKAAGYDAVIRYVGFDPADRRKCVSADEYHDHLANGVEVAFVYEDTTGAALAGRVRGIADANAVLACAAAIGAPVPACYFAVDFDAQPAQYPAIEAYFVGALDVLGYPRVGAYGSYYVINHLFDVGLITFGWQTTAWSHGHQEARAHLFQRLGSVVVDGVTCDVNDILQANFGQTSTEDDMTPEQDVLLRDIHEQLCGNGSRTPGPYPGWGTWEGSGRSLTVVDLLREAHRELTAPLTSRVPGSTVTDTMAGYTRNADAYTYQLLQLAASQHGVSAQDIAAALAPSVIAALPAHLAGLGPADLADIAKAVADEQGRRLATPQGVTK